MAARSRSAGPSSPAATGAGRHNHEMKRLMLAHALASVAECRFLVGEANTRSRRALEKIGARLTDRREERIMAGGEIIPHLTYVITREDFAQGPLCHIAAMLSDYASPALLPYPARRARHYLAPLSRSWRAQCQPGAYHRKTPDLSFAAVRL